MKRIILIAAWVAVLISVQVFVNCSNPLESTEPPPSGPIIDVDTVFNTDTVTVLDTLNNADTVIVIEPDPSGSQIVCSRIASNQKEIVWMFRNSEGPYNLAFVASTESAQPAQKLTVNIDGQKFQWNPAANTELIQELDLEQNSIIWITTNKPPALGHAIFVCLTISAREGGQ